MPRCGRSASPTSPGSLTGVAPDREGPSGHSVAAALMSRCDVLRLPDAARQGRPAAARGQPRHQLVPVDLFRVDVGDADDRPRAVEPHPGAQDAPACHHHRRHELRGLDRRRPGGPALSGLLSLRGSGRLVQRHERLSLRSPRSSGRERGLRAGGLVACRRSSFFASLFSRLFLPVLRSSSSANRFPVRVVIRSCGAHVLHRAAPTPKVSSWISTPGDGRRLRFGVVCVVTLRQPPQATGDQAWDECSSRGDDRRSDAGPRRSRCSPCRGQACGRRARRPTDGGGTAPQVPAQVRVGDDRRFTASGPIRLAVHRSQPVLPSAASTRAWSAVARKSASYRVQIAVTAGRARECSRRSRLTAHARRRAFARHPPGGRTNMLSQGSSTRCLAQQAAERIAGCLGGVSPTTADCGS